MDRRGIGSWLEGPGSGLGGDEQAYAGQRLGLPADGPGSLAGLGARLVALAIDWAACLLVAGLFVPWGDPGYGLATLGVYVVEAALGTWLGGASFGQRLRRLRVLRLDGSGSPDPLRALLRTLLIALVVPAVVWDRDGRGLHDKVAGTAVVRA